MSDSFASFLIGRPVVFFQAGGQLDRGMRNWDLAGFAQDEWRATRRLTVNLGVRYEISTPYGDIRDRLNAFVPGQQSTVFPDAPKSVLFPGDEGVDKRVAPVYYRGFMPRVGLAWDPTGSGKLSVRSSYGIFYDGFTNGANAPYQAPLSALPWTQAYQLGGPFLDYVDPFGGQQPPFTRLNFPRPTTMLTVERGMRPPYAQNWNLSLQRALAGSYLVELQYVGTKGTRLPRFIEANPAVYAPGASSQDAERRRIYADCPPDSSQPCALSSVGLLVNSTNSTYHALQATLTRRFQSGLGFQMSYWFSKTLDYVSSLNLSGSSPRLLSGENDLAQNPFDLKAEHGPSLFDARHRLVSSWSYELPFFRGSSGWGKTLLGGWQWNGIAVLSSATPYTVYDSANVSLQAQHPEISGFTSARPDLASDPNRGPHTVEQWVSRSAFRRLDLATEAGKFGNAGRNVVRGPAFGNLDLSLLKSFPVGETQRFEFRAECFNVTNHPNFGLPVNDIASPNFGRILSSGPPRLLQFGLKFLF
jgi:hypothetical protein